MKCPIAKVVNAYRYRKQSSGENDHHALLCPRLPQSSQLVNNPGHSLK
ncbi:MAG: hypothetical protein ACETWK_06810 [Candidatus Aminicenantaceae bacterium]